MTELISEETVSNISLEDAKELRKQISRKIVSMRRKKSLRMEVYIQPKYRNDVETAREWAYKNGFIERDTKWTFAKFCIINTTKMIVDQIEKEQALHQRTPNSQEQHGSHIL